MANSKPHTHTARIHRRWEELQPSWDNTWMVTYGDTSVRVCSGMKQIPTEKQVRKATAKAIRKHDNGSQTVSHMDHLQQVAQSVTSDWTKESLNG